MLQDGWLKGPPVPADIPHLHRGRGGAQPIWLVFIGIRNAIGSPDGGEVGFAAASNVDLWLWEPLRQNLPCGEQWRSPCAWSTWIGGKGARGGQKGRSEVASKVAFGKSGQLSRGVQACQPGARPPGLIQGHLPSLPSLGLHLDAP